MRFLMLLCFMAIVLTGFYGFVYYMLYVTFEYKPISKPFVPYIDNPVSYHNHTNQSCSTCNISIQVDKLTETEDTLDSNDSIYSDTDLDELAKNYPEVHKGGWYSPPNVTALERVAIIVPYRDREVHLRVFLKIMHLLLMQQQIEYGIFIIEQEGTLPFNRGKLLNVGFVESQNMGNWECFISHDVDLLPADPRITYRCGLQPRHMSAAVNTWSYMLPYNTMFGGVTAIKRDQFKKVNGYSNIYWGWGGEDDDLFRRLWLMNYRITRYNSSIARYIMLEHDKQPPNQKRRLNLAKTRKMFKRDGLSSLKYVVRNITWHHLFTHILANIDDKSALDGDPYVAAKFW